MKAEIKRLVERHYGAETIRIESLGGGFYGRVFAVDMDREPFKIVIKLYLFPNLAEEEARQIRTLSPHAKVTMPEVYFVEPAGVGGHDAMGMSFVRGVNAGSLEQIPPSTVEHLAAEIVDNLLSYHRVTNPLGFGPLDSDEFFPDWRDCYRPMAAQILRKAGELSLAGKLDRSVLQTMEEAVNRFDEVFCVPINRSGLIHGDYNTWNVLLTEDLRHVSAVIDPFNSCWADPEFDLYQLDNANGRSFGLLSLYSEKAELSENFWVKRQFYELFTELNHHYDAQVETRNSNIPRLSMALNRSLMEL